MTACFFFYGYGGHRDLLSFPTRRSSDLATGSTTTVVAVPASTRRTPYSITARTPSPRSTVVVTPRSASPTSSSRSEEHTSELQSRQYIVCRLLLEKKQTAPASDEQRFRQ